MQSRLYLMSICIATRYDIKYDNMVDGSTITKSMLDSALKDAVTDIASIIGDFSGRVDERFNKVEADMADLNSKYDHLLNTLDAFLKRLDDIESDNTARDAHLERLERWLHQVASKLEIELH